MGAVVWEVVALGWRDGEHAGTLVGARGLELVPGVSRGRWERGLPPRGSFTRLVASLNPEPWAVGSGVRLSVRVRVGEAWSPWRSLGIYGAGAELPRSELAEERPRDPQRAVEPRVEVDVDVLRLPAGAAEEVTVRLELEAGELGGSPVLRRLALVGWSPPGPPGDGGEGEVARAGEGGAEVAVFDDVEEGAGWGRTLALAPRSQRALPGDLPARACSPTSLAMLLSRWGCELATEEVARAVFDRGAQVYGNWSFNVAFAATLGLEATVARMSRMSELEAELLAGRPLVISHRWRAGELSGAPMASSAGHLVVVVGLTARGDVVVADPAADPRRGEALLRTYRRAELARTWLRNGEGIAYLVRPLPPEARARA